MASECTNLLVMAMLSTALPAFFVAVTVVMSLMMTGRIDGRTAMIVLLVCLVSAFLPSLVMWLFGSKLTSDEKMAACAASILNNGLRSQKKISATHASMRSEMPMPVSDRMYQSSGMPTRDVAPQYPQPPPAQPQYDADMDYGQRGEDFMGAFA